MTDYLSKRLLLWGWLRMLLGVLQMSCSVAAVWAIFQIGFEPLTWELIFVAAGASIVSRLLFRGRKDPQVETARNESAPPTNEIAADSGRRGNLKQP